MKSAFFLLLFVSGIAEGQTRRKPRPPEPPKPMAPAPAAWPIGSLTVQGNRNYTEKQILAVAGLKAGEVADKAAFEAARDRLLVTGAFESVGYKFAPAAGGQQYVASFQVVEVGQVFPYRFESIRVNEAALKRWLQENEPLLGDKIPATPQVLERMARAVERHLADPGEHASVVGKLAAERPNEMEVVFQPSNLPSVAQVQFAGNELVPGRTLQQTVSGAAIGSIFTEARFRQILETSLRPLYESQGRLRVAFPKITTTPAKEVKGLNVTVQVEEGPEFKLRDVRITGPLADNRILLKTGGFKIGEPVNFTSVKEGMDRMVRSLQRNGYVQAKASLDRRIDDKEKAVDVNVKIDPGALFAMGKLTIEGLDIQTEPHVRKLWGLKAGKPFDTEYPDFFLRRMDEERLFDNLGKTTSSTRIDEQEHLIDVTLVFKGDNKPRPRIGPDAEQKPPQSPPF